MRKVYSTGGSALFHLKYRLYSTAPLWLFTKLREIKSGLTSPHNCMIRSLRGASPRVESHGTALQGPPAPALYLTAAASSSVIGGDTIFMPTHQPSLLRCAAASAPVHCSVSGVIVIWLFSNVDRVPSWFCVSASSLPESVPSAPDTGRRANAIASASSAAVYLRFIVNTPPRNLERYTIST